MTIYLRPAAAVCAVSLLALLPAASTAAGAVSHPQQRQIAVTTLTNFKTVLTVTRGPESGAAPMATVTAAGYRHTAHGWKLIVTKQIGKSGQWFWYPTEVCSLTATQLKAEPSSAVNSDSIKVSLLITPAIGCSKTYTISWRP